MKWCSFWFTRVHDTKRWRLIDHLHFVEATPRGYINKYSYIELRPPVYKMQSAVMDKFETGWNRFLHRWNLDVAFYKDWIGWWEPKNKTLNIPNEINMNQILGSNMTIYDPTISIAGRSMTQYCHIHSYTSNYVKFARVHMWLAFKIPGLKDHIKWVQLELKSWFYIFAMKRAP